MLRPAVRQPQWGVFWNPRTPEAAAGLLPKMALQPRKPCLALNMTQVLGYTQQLAVTTEDKHWGEDESRRGSSSTNTNTDCETQGGARR